MSDTATAPALPPGLSAERLSELKAYIMSFQPHCDRHLSRIAEPAGKRVLVVGSGWGTEVLWALRQGAAEVVGVDPSRRSTEPLQACLDELGLSPNYQLERMTTLDLPKTRDFDLIVSNNVAEHIHGLKATFESFRGLLGPGGRIGIFTDPLYYSSMGAHLKIDPWEHLHAVVEHKVPEQKWKEYLVGLNRMTVIDFLTAVRESGLICLDFRLIPDRNLKRFKDVEGKTFHTPFDLGCEGITTKMCFPEHI